MILDLAKCHPTGLKAIRVLGITRNEKLLKNRKKGKGSFAYESREIIASSLTGVTGDQFCERR